MRAHASRCLRYSSSLPVLVSYCRKETFPKIFDCRLDDRLKWPMVVCWVLQTVSKNLPSCPNFVVFYLHNHYHKSLTTNNLNNYHNRILNTTKNFSMPLRVSSHHREDSAKDSYMKLFAAVFLVIIGILLILCKSVPPSKHPTSPACVPFDSLSVWSPKLISCPFSIGFIE